ncbi:hypothetical protein DESUT3_08660 [Desulfuromonas versatilis]|uniref:GerMN domain-containing protein n=1 Tax=Desulfuromonas versatilis TaxID=2802975 RepID=A0ABM8HTJ1_9BACT|nr:GerMN domain-containing protein [Desulfuromonas versatilis]BCR03797.1 hypothetical protein DESUT3_08660 [Desulfuromonas versatilis]
MRGHPFSDRILLVCFLLVLVAFSILAGLKYFGRPPAAPGAVPPPTAEAPRQLREVILYFGDQGGNLLVAEAREIEGCTAEPECLQGIVQALVAGPSGDLVPLFPRRAVVRGVQVDEATATVDFSSDLVSGHPGGSVSELLTVYGLADTLAVNFPHIRQVRVLVEGQGADTLKGHVDLREPIPADFSFVRPTPKAEPTDATRELLENQPAEPLEKAQ